MHDILSTLARLRRPQLLMKAARIGAADYDREARLPALLGAGPLPRHGAALVRLMEYESMLDEARRGGAAGYAVTAHVEVMIALLGEMRMLADTQAAAVAIQRHRASVPPIDAPATRCGYRTATATAPARRTVRPAGTARHRVLSNESVRHL